MGLSFQVPGCCLAGLGFRVAFRVLVPGFGYVLNRPRGTYTITGYSDLGEQTFKALLKCLINA